MGRTRKADGEYKTTEAQREYVRRYRERNKEKVQQYAREYYSANKEKMNEATRKWVADNPERHRANVARAHKEARAWIAEYKGAHPCVRCGETDPACLDFHHRDPSTKLFNVGIHGSRAISSIKDEVAKCDVLCTNCHRKLHAYELKVKGGRPRKHVIRPSGTIKGRVIESLRAKVATLKTPDEWWAGHSRDGIDPDSAEPYVARVRRILRECPR